MTRALVLDTVIHVPSRHSDSVGLPDMYASIIQRLAR